MRARRSVVVAIALLAGLSLSTVAAGQNALHRGDGRTIAAPWACDQIATVPTVAILDRSSRLEWCLETWDARAATQEYRLYLAPDAAPYLLESVTCDDVAHRCQAPVPPAALIPLSSPDIHTVELATALPGGGAAESPRAAVVLDVPDGCAYAAPGVVSPPIDRRPIGDALQGFNATVGQAARIGQLRAWGWRVEWQYVDGTTRADKTDRLYLMAWCVGPPQ